MFTLLLKLFQSSVVFLLLNDYLKRTFPEDYEKYLIECSLKIVYLFSKCQIMKNNLCNKINTVVEQNVYLKKIFDEIYKKKLSNEICQVKGINIYLKYFTDISEIKYEDDKNSFYVFSDNINAADTCVNKVILHTQPFLINYELSNIYFILFEITFNDNTYKLNLKTSEFNYYVVNNILDKKFFIYYLYNYQICNLTEEDIDKIDSFNVKIIDQNVNIKELEITDEKFIIIKKDEYIY